jgi:hypothetical protein
MIEATLTWHGEQILSGIETISWERLLRAAQFLHQQLQETVGIPYPPASRPGEPPRRRTGKGQRSIVLVPDKATGTIWVGTTRGAQYMMSLDTTRPWIEITIRKNRAPMQAILRGER